MRARLLWICLGLTLGLVLGVLAFDMWASVAFAQKPFGAPRSASPPVPSYGGGITGWLLAKQAEFYRAMSGAIRDAKTDGSAVGVLLGISFLYGIFHAAGPGHGKAVISSYMVANEETARRGIILSFASALLQALVAILIVGVLALLLRATSQTMCNAERIVEIVSYGLIALLGARLVWIKGRGFVADGSVTDFTGSTIIDGPAEPDTGIGRVNAMAVRNDMKWAKCVSASTTWYAPKIGIVRWRQEVSANGVVAIQVMRLTKLDLK